ncbi:oligosaccharide flippase family protein [Aggregatilineales bacterium SYSU G02658]
MTESAEKHKGRGLLRAALMLITGSGLSAALSFVLTVLLARFLTPTDFTSYTLTLAWLFPAVLIAEFGLSTLFLREVAPQPAHTRPLLRQLLPLRLALSAMVGAAFVLLLTAADGGLTLSHLLIASPLLVSLPLFNLLSAALRARALMGWVAALNVGMLLAQAGLLLLRPAWRADEALLLNTLTSAGQLLAAAWIVGHVTRQEHALPVSLDLRDWLRRCFPFAVASALGAVQARLTLLLLDQQFTPVETAQYIVAARFADAARLLLMAFFDALYPRLSAAAVTGGLERLRRLLLYTAAAYSVLAALALQAAPWVIVLLFSSAYYAAIPLLPAMSVAFIAAALSASVRLYCYAVGFERQANSATFITIVATAAAALVQWPSISSFVLAVAALEAVTTGGLALRVVYITRRAATTGRYTPAG